MLILVLNAAKYSPTVIPLFEPHTLRHYAYLRDTMPTLVPELCLSESADENTLRPTSAPESLEFLASVINNLDMTDKSYSVQLNLLQTAKGHLHRLSDMDSTVAGTAQFTALYIGAQLLMTQILHNGLWANPSNLATQQANNLKTNIQQLLENCLKLQYLFVGLSPNESCAVKQFRLRALALNLVYVVKGMLAPTFCCYNQKLFSGTSASALAPCHYFLSALEDMQSELNGACLEPDDFTSSILKELSVVEEPKPGTVARILIPVLAKAKLGSIPSPNIKVAF